MNFTDEEKREKMRYIWELCDEVGVSVPEEVKEYFNYQKPQDETGILFPPDEFPFNTRIFIDDDEEEWVKEQDRIEQGIQGEYFIEE